VASYVGIDFGDAEPWAQYFRVRQVKEGPYIGGFYADQSHHEVIFEDIYHSISALHQIQKATKSPTRLADSIDLEGLVRYANMLPRSIKTAAYSYNAISRTSAFQSTFKITTQYDVLESRYRLVGDRIIQGTQVKPALSVRTHYGIAHTGLDVTMTITQKKTSGEKNHAEVELECR
jgi:hypothetical protein